MCRKKLLLICYFSLDNSVEYKRREGKLVWKLAGSISKTEDRNRVRYKIPSFTLERTVARLGHPYTLYIK
jgi:hypothetical protein